MKILYEDNHIIAAVKPFNMPSQQDKSNDPDILSLLKEYIKKKYDKKGSVYLGLIHRLDRPAGGVMVFARTSKAASRLSRDIREGKVEKIYFAVLQKRPEKDAGELTGYIVKDREKNISKIADKDEKGAKSAKLGYEVISEKEGLALVKIQLETGRSHQIRVQFKDLGCPLYGDARYGNADKKQLALWSHKIIFKHPVKDEIITIEAAPPKDYPWSLF